MLRHTMRALLLLCACVSLAVGQEKSKPTACTGCHLDVKQDFVRTAHATAEADKKDCVACHGESEKHIAAEGDKPPDHLAKSASKQQIVERCLTCHGQDEERGNFRRSEHKGGGLSCLSCHRVHFSPVRRPLLRKAQVELCVDCHARQKAEFARPSRHPLANGAVQCTDCHAQHGSFAPRQMRSASGQQALCAKCHQEQSGPFVFEHTVVRGEGCVTCHQPHGSANPRLLKQPTVNLLCLRCHTPGARTARETPGFHNQNERFQACTLCHTDIHGSNLHQAFLR